MRKILFSSFVASLYLSAASCVLATSEDPLPSMSSKSASAATGASSGEGSDDDNSPDIVVEYGKVRDTSVFPVDPMQRVADLLIDPVLARERVSAFKASLQNEETDEASDLARCLEFFQAFYSLSNEEKILERESYTRLLRHLVEQAQMDRPMSLSHQKALLCDVYHMGMVDIYETAANCYIAHPDFRASQGTDPLAGARAYGFLNQYTKSCILYQMAWKHQKTLFSMQDFYFFINAIQKEGIAKKAGLFSSSIADVCFEVLRRSEPYEDGDDRLPERTLLYCVDILAHLNCIADAKSVLKRYFSRQDDYIINSHVAAANLYLESNEPEMAAYYWSNALAKGYKPVQRDVMSALESFLKNKDTKRALKLWEDYKASEEPKTPELLVHAAYHFKLASMDEKAIECVEQALELPQEKELEHHPCCTAAMIYSGAHLHHKAVRLWRMIRKTTQPFEARQAIYIPMVYSFAAVGDFKEASACIHELTQEALTNPLVHSYIQEMPIAEWAMHHLRAGEVDRANDFMKLYGH